MSWTKHVDELMKGPKMKRAGVFGLAGNVWAVTNGFSISEEEVKNLMTLAASVKYRGEKITVCGKKYIYSSHDEEMITVLSLGEEKTACTACITSEFVLVGEGEAGVAGQGRAFLSNYSKFLYGALKQ